MIPRVCSGDALVKMYNSSEEAETAQKRNRSSAKRAKSPLVPESIKEEEEEVSGSGSFRLVSWENALNAGPTLAVMGIVALVFGAATLFLDKYVITRPTT